MSTDADIAMDLRLKDTLVRLAGCGNRLAAGVPASAMEEVLRAYITDAELIDANYERVISACRRTGYYLEEAIALRSTFTQMKTLFERELAAVVAAKAAKPAAAAATSRQPPS